MKLSTRIKLSVAAAGMLFWFWFLLTGCSSAPPGSYGVNAFGFGVTYSTPGWSAVPPVVQTPVITAPTLLVPPDSPAASAKIAQASTGATVQVVVAPVKTETLAVPAK